VGSVVSFTTMIQISQTSQTLKFLQAASLPGPGQHLHIGSNLTHWI